MSAIDEAFGPRPPLTTEAACTMVVRSGAIIAILVEGWSDQAALEALAHRRGLNLAAERIVILPIGGATNTGKFLDALGPAGLGVRLLAVQGELESFRRFQDQPAQRTREGHAQLRRFMGTRARRKIRYGALLTNALDLRCVPRALDAVLAHARESVMTA